MDFTRLGPGIRPKVRDALVEVRNYLFLPYGDVFYVSKRGTSGDGKSWTQSFLTITEGIAALTDNDTLIIGAGDFDEEAPKITLSGVKNVRIFGNSDGMQWGQGFTNWRSVTSGADLLDMAGCQGVEIGGIGFIIPTDNMDAINYAGLNYSVHVHHCGFIGDCGDGAKMAYGINAAGTAGRCADLHVDHCRFFRCKTGIFNLGQRCVIEKNVFIVPASGYGIQEIDFGAVAYNLIDSNLFFGSASGDYGIFTTTATAGNFMVSRNRFCNFEDAKAINQTLEVSVNFVDNLEDHAEGADRKVDPTTT